MNPIAFNHLFRLNESQFFQEEKIGELQYISHYIPVLNDDGYPIGVLALKDLVTNGIIPHD
jgi:hypothetical protein